MQIYWIQINRFLISVPLLRST